MIKFSFFYDDVTLLVGLSGVGKTQILNAIEYSLNLAVRKDIILKPYDVSIGIYVDDIGILILFYCFYNLCF